ncbi:MAG TPA: 30S ribosomal protein S16 [Candidatus Saccharimonadales bacterium]|nr:30S ribosomal protein S16 [Candidatus Saccharimonadales bacterium]
MALVIRLARTGKRGERKFRVVVKEKRDKRDGKAMEYLGWYEKRVTGEKKELNTERIKYWLSVGAQTTPTMKKLLETN